MYRKLFVLGLLVCICMAGCQSTPQEVIRKSEGYQNNKEIKSGDMEFDTLENVKKKSVEDLKIQTQNLILPDKISWGTTDNIYSMTMKYKENFVEKREEIAKIFGFKIKKWESSRNFGNKVVEEDRGHYIAVIDNGFASAVSEEYWAASKDSEQTTIETIDLMKGDNTDIQCNLNGEKVNLDEEIRFVQEWFDKNWIL